MNHPNNDDQYIAHLEGENERLKDKLKRWKPLIKEAEKIEGHGWGKVVLTITRGGERMNIDNTFTGMNRIKDGGTDPE